MRGLRVRWGSRVAALAALLVLALGAASCGDDDDGGGDAGASAQSQSQGALDPASFDDSPEGQVRAAHARMVNVVYSEHPERLCEFSSRKAQREWISGKADSCEEGVKTFYDTLQKLSKDRPRVLKVRIQGRRALARTQVKGSNVYSSVFVKEDGEWKLDKGGP